MKDLIFVFRSIRKNILLAGINVLGLTTGIAACLVIFLIAAYELRFDRFQPDRDRIYRIYASFSGVFSGENPGSPTGVAVAVRDGFTGVEAVTNFHTFTSRVKIPLAGGGVKDMERYEKVIIADPEYFHVFSHYTWRVGDPQASLSEPFQVVLTEQRARTYFGDVDLRAVIGKEILYRDSLRLTVSGIVADVTKPTDFDFTDFISFSTIEKSWLNDEFILLNDWENTNSSSQVFIKLSKATALEDIQRQMPGLAAKYEAHNPNSNLTNTPTLQAFGDIHFDTDLGIFDYSRAVVGWSTIRILIVVAVLLLIIAVVNFVNLETAQASLRAKEVGVRKVLGSTRRRLIARFLLESFVLSAVAVLAATGLAAMSIRWFREFVPEGLSFELSDPLVWLFLCACLLSVTVLAGIYPAFVLSSYQPATALKNISAAGNSRPRSASIRQVLTVFQFCIAQVLIVATIAIGFQLDFMTNKELGFEREGIVNIQTPWFEDRALREVFRNELEKIPGIEAISMFFDPPIYFGYSSSIMEFDNGKEIMKHNVFIKRGDTSYVDFFGIRLLAGRMYTAKEEPDECVINETYMRELGFTNPHDVLGKEVKEQFTIVGVIEDFHTRSLHHAIEPTAIYYAKSAPTIGVKLPVAGRRVGDLKPTIDRIGEAFKKVYPDAKFNYEFMDDMIGRFYENEQRTGKLARAATGIAIVVSCLGLFGLSTFTVLQRTKEIGIRKVLGASINSILFLLSATFLKLVVIAFLIAAPLAWYLADWWLADFAYRMELSMWMFAGSAFFCVAVAFLTISFRTVRAARTNPVDTLRYE